MSFLHALLLTVVGVVGLATCLAVVLLIAAELLGVVDWERER